MKSTLLSAIIWQCLLNTSLNFKRAVVIMESLKECVFYGILFVCSICMMLSCGKKEKVDFSPQVIKISGSADLLREGAKESLAKDLAVKTGDIIRVGKRSHVAILIGKSRALYLNENTGVKIEYIQEEDNSDLSLNVNLLYGEAFSEFITSADVRIAYAVSTPTVSVVGRESCFDVAYYTNNKVTIIKSLEGQTAVFPNNRECVDVSECKKILVNNDGNVSRLVSITTKDIDEFKKWVGKERVESIIVVSGCISEQEEERNLPPVWECEPKKTCRPGIPLVDQLSAKDPEGTKVHYFLIKGPKNMKISESGGVLHYKPYKPGTFEVRVCAEDELSNSSYLQYHLTVVGNLNAVLKVQETIKAEDEFKIDASRSVNGHGKRKGLLYRFDINNDGVWDYPVDGTFRSEASVIHSYKKPGEYTIKVQVKDKDQKTAIASKVIEVTIPPEIQLSYTPLFGTVGTEYTISVKQRDGREEPSEELLVRWDLNGDGRWDYPSDGGFTDEIEIRHMWDKAGAYKVTAEAEDNNKNRISVSKKLIVYRGITIEELQGPDTVNVNENITVNCVAKDPDFAIVEYAWDFAGVGMFGEKSKKPSVDFSYKEAGIYTLVCCATNEKGMSASESKGIVVASFLTEINAGGPYKTNVNIPLTVKGYAKDIDNKIISYFWDFDNDKKYEWKSEKTSKTEHAFSRQGTYVIRFGVKMDDGTMSEDTAIVSVVNRPPKAVAGEDIISRKKKKVKLNGIGEDPDENIIKYEWDFNGDGTYEWSSKDTGFTEYSFMEYTSAVFRVTDKEGISATDTVTIVICPKGMKTVPEGKFCIDIYEWPNEKGKKPKRNITYKEAEAECRKIGKRLCSAKEMKTACKGGKEKYVYPYGRKYEADNCNTYGNRHTDNQVARSGEFLSCTSRYGVFDMIGNVAEWASAGEGEFRYAIGGWWHNGEKRARCGSYIPLKKNKKYMYVGFRCCK